MSSIEGDCKEVVGKSEWMATATAGPDGPHLAACWRYNARALGLTARKSSSGQGGMLKPKNISGLTARVELDRG